MQLIVQAQADSTHDVAASSGIRAGYVGDEACQPCHTNRAATFASTAHHLTSQLPTSTSILGSFKEGDSILMIENPAITDTPARLFFKMESNNGEFFQAAVAEKGPQKLRRSEQIDIVTGSGVRGQTYLYWKGNALFELPASYWTDGHQWINSPGYQDGTANFARHVDARCLECHATYIKALSNDPQENLYDRDSFIPGISCETCHGPAADHVANEQKRARPTTETGSASIRNPAKFSRDRQIDLCGLCHSGGQRAELTPAFSYRPGEPLDKFFAPDPAEASDRPDVHGNQVALLKKSRCFQSSPEMTCSTCHDVHASERNAAAYSDRCLSCHKWQSCGESRKLGKQIVSNCIDCHMPMQQTDAIVSTTAGRSLHTSIRNHWIKVYPG